MIFSCILTTSLYVERHWVVFNYFIQQAVILLTFMTFEGCSSNDSLILRAFLVSFWSAWLMWCHLGSPRFLLVLPKGAESPGQAAEWASVG